MMTLFYNIPLIVGDKVPNDSNAWEVLLLLLDAVKIICCPSVTESATHFLQSVIKDHHMLFLSEYPQHPFTPKQHFMVHYPRIIRLLGPLCQYSSMRFEGKHKPLKNYARVCNNFQNISHTLARKHQMCQSYKLIVRVHLGEKDFEVYGQSIEPITSLRLTEGEIHDMALEGADTVVVSNRVEVCGYQFRPGSMVVLQDTEEDEYPNFAQIEVVVVTKGKLFFIVQPWETILFERHYHSFAVKPSPAKLRTCVEPHNLLDYRPLNVAQSHAAEEGVFFIPMRHHLR